MNHFIRGMGSVLALGGRSDYYQVWQRRSVRDIIAANWARVGRTLWSAIDRTAADQLHRIYRDVGPLYEDADDWSNDLRKLLRRDDRAISQVLEEIASGGHGRPVPKEKALVLATLIVDCLDETCEYHRSGDETLLDSKDSEVAAWEGCLAAIESVLGSTDPANKPESPGSEPAGFLRRENEICVGRPRSSDGGETGAALE
ncbi:MAG: hypothetical protein RDU20_23015 [Desulfomonilaceae bacterium]|nr:hypothetical protein [Desulfomonilaceae bacterium]